MKPEAQRIAIAEACSTLQWSYALPQKCVAASVPDYCNDLNAMHEAEKTLQHYGVFVDKLAEIMGQPRQGIMLVNATAAQRAEAFLRTIGKWDVE